MKHIVALAFAGFAVAAPIVAPGAPDGILPGWLQPGDVDRVMDGESLDEVAEDVARRDWTVRARLDVLAVERIEETYDDFGSPVRPGRGHEFWRVHLRLENHGRMPVGAYTYHFHAVDDRNVSRMAELGVAERIFTFRIDQGRAVEGELVFDVREGFPPTRLVWEGDLGRVEAPLPPPEDGVFVVP